MICGGWWGEIVGCYFPARKEFRQSVLWMAEAVTLVAARSGYEPRLAKASAGALGALMWPREALLLYKQGEAGQGTAATSDSWIIRGRTATAAESGREAGAGATLEGAGPRY